MRFQIQWDTNNRGPTFSTLAAGIDPPGVSVAQAIAALDAVHAKTVPQAAQQAATPAVDAQKTWVRARPPTGIATGGYSRSEYFRYRRYTDARCDVENVRGHNLRT